MRERAHRLRTCILPAVSLQPACKSPSPSRAGEMQVNECNVSVLAKLVIHPLSVTTQASMVQVVVMYVCAKHVQYVQQLNASTQFLTIVHLENVVPTYSFSYCKIVTECYARDRNMHARSWPYGCLKCMPQHICFFSAHAAPTYSCIHAYAYKGTDDGCLDADFQACGHATHTHTHSHECRPRFCCTMFSDETRK